MKILGDFQTTVKKALGEIDPKWMDYPGLIVCGTHTPEAPEELIKEITEARENGLPFLGICFGHQLAAIEFARNVLGIVNATSEEWGDKLSPFIVHKVPGGLNVGQKDGETYWNNYEVIEGVLEVWKKPDNFITVQYHPEYQSSKDKPHSVLLKFLYHAKNHE